LTKTSNVVRSRVNKLLKKGVIENPDAEEEKL
jgi:hypothetical protein